MEKRLVAQNMSLKQFKSIAFNLTMLDGCCAVEDSACTADKVDT